MKSQAKTREVTITVTQEDITQGTPVDCNNDPVAIAIKRQCFPDCAAEVWVSFSSVDVVDGSLHLYTGYFPRHVKDFIRQFDRFFHEKELRDQLKPFSFELTLRSRSASA